MKDRKKQDAPAKVAEVEIEAEEGAEEYIERLKYVIEKLGLKFYTHDGGIVNIHIHNFMSGVPKDPPPY